MPVEPPTTNPGPTVLATLPNPSRQIGGPASLKEQPIGFRSISGLSTYLDPTGAHEAQFFSDILEITHSANLTTTRILRPNGVGGANVWTPSAGANWQNVDEATADDDTTYNSTATVGDQDLFAYPDLSPALPTGAVISKIVVHMRVRCTTAVATFINFTWYNGVDNYTLVAALLAADTDYHDIEVTLPGVPTGTGTFGAAWTEATANAAQFGYQKATDDGVTLRVTQIYATVHYYITPSGTRGSTGYSKGFDWGALYSKRSAGLDADTDAVNNSETLVNISELFVTVGKNRSCAFTAWLFYDAATAADIKFTVAVPADAVAYLAGIGPSTGIAAAIGDAAFRYSAATGTPAAIAFGGAGVGTIVCVLLFGRVSFVTQGELQLQFAQNTANVSDAKVRAASYLDVEIH